MTHDAPRYLRFARALALVSGIAAPLVGCAMQHGSDSGSADSGAADAPTLADAGTDAPYVNPCLSCECVFGGDMPPPPDSCDALGHADECCFAVGPLLPPDLPA